MTAGAGACGNRLSEDTLMAAAGRENNSDIDPGSQQVPGGGSPVGGPEATASTSVADPGSTAGVAGATSGDPTPAAAPAGNAGSPRSANAGGAGSNTGANTGSAGGAAGKSAASSGSAASPGGGASGGTGGTETVPGAGGTPGGGQAAPGASGSCSGAKAPIVIGSVGEYSGLLGPIEAPGVRSVQAWVAATNANGGLNCHPVKYVVYDTGGDPSRGQSMTQRAVEEDKAIAFVYNGAALSGQASSKYLEERRIPVIGEEGAQPAICYGAMGFSVMSSCNEGIQGIYQILAKVIKPGDQVAAITCNEVPFCTGYRSNAEKYAAEAGFKLVYNGSVSMTQPDYTSACVQAKNAGATALILGMEGTSASRLRRSCKSVGLDVPIISNGTAFSASSGDPGMEGAWIASGTRFTPPNHPGVAEWLGAMKQYVPGAQPSPNGGIGWVAAKVFELAARNMPDTPTNEAVLEGLWAIKGNDIGGMTKPLTYLKDAPAQQAPACWFANTLEKGGWAGDTRICL
jgi:branched-chain amino acid transport system substrate-binding protein